MVAAASDVASSPQFETHFVSAADGLKLHVRVWGAAHREALPVVCLPGLARTADDFDALAYHLATDPAQPRRVLALDYRGRGASDYDRDPQNYNLAVELADAIAVVTALEVHPAVYVGTSRGGLLAMLLAAARPTLLAGAVLNDIGPVIESKGLMRIKSYVGKLPQPKDFEDGAEILRRLFSAQFPRLTAADWRSAALRTWRETDGRLVLRYDARLADTLKGVDAAQPLPPMWPQFDALGHVPVMAIRGANSDILSAETVAAMRTRRPDLKVLEVPDQGHPPLLEGPDIADRIRSFVELCAS
jgi:pimeloyl-ACP methyl ester carboxylesterase